MTLSHKSIVKLLWYAGWESSHTQGLWL